MSGTPGLARRPLARLLAAAVGGHRPRPSPRAAAPRDATGRSRRARRRAPGAPRPPAPPRREPRRPVAVDAQELGLAPRRDDARHVIDDVGGRPRAPPSAASSSRSPGTSRQPSARAPPPSRASAPAPYLVAPRGERFGEVAADEARRPGDRAFIAAGRRAGRSCSARSSSSRARRSWAVVLEDPARLAPVISSPARSSRSSDTASRRRPCRATRGRTPRSRMRSARMRRLRPRAA